MGSEDGIIFCDYQGGYAKVGWDDTYDDKNSEVTALATAVVPLPVRTTSSNITIAIKQPADSGVQL